MSQMTLFPLLDATLQTVYMVFLGSFIAILVGLPLGTILYVTRKNHILQQPVLHYVLSTVVNMTRSIPFVILMIAVIPFTRLIVGSSIGTNAAIVPLSLCAIPFLARVVENALLEVNKGLIETASAMGATAWQIIIKVLIPEALPSIINGFTLTIISLIGYSAMAGVVGGGGLGDMAYRYGYTRFNTSIMLITIAIMIIFVQAIQYFGDKITKRITHSRG